MTDRDGRDFLVVYEEADDDFKPEDPLDIEVGVERPHVKQDAEVEFGAVVGNERSAVATIGLVVSLIGAVLGIVMAIVFAVTYPQNWWPERGTTLAGHNVDETTMLVMTYLGLAMAVCLLVGALLVGFSRRLRAYGVLHSIHFKPAQRR